MCGEYRGAVLVLLAHPNGSPPDPPPWQAWEKLTPPITAWTSRLFFASIGFAGVCGGGERPPLAPPCRPFLPSPLPQCRQRSSSRGLRLAMERH